MKTFKRNIAFMLALVLTLAMSITAYADEAKTYSITIDNAVAGHTYEAYQIFTGDLSEDETTLSNIKWGEGISEDGQTAIGDAVAYAESLGKIESNSSEATAEAEKLSSYLSTPSAVVSVPADSTEVSYKMSGLKAGYYLIKDKNETLTGTDKSYTEFILKLVKDQTVKPKSGTTTVEKKVKDINDSTDKAGAYTDWQDSADYDIGDVVPFKLEAKLAENVSAYDTYYLNFHDTLSKGLEYVDGSFEVTIDGTKVTDSFTASYSKDEKESNLTFKCDDVKKIGATSESVVVVTYNAILTSDAVIGSAGNPNDVYLEFSNNPNSEGDGEHGETPKDTVIVFTYKVVVNKIDADEKPLKGAAFELYKKLEDGTEVKIGYKEIGDDDTTTFSFEGLDDGEYRLHESKTPDGYNTIDDITFTVTADHDIVSDSPALNKLTGDCRTGAIEFTSNIAEGSLTSKVVNQKGSVLPSTGGAGRIAIYVVGGVLLVGAGILLVTKKRVR